MIEDPQKKATTMTNGCDSNAKKITKTIIFLFIVVVLVGIVK